MYDVQEYWNLFWTKRKEPGSQNDFFFQSLSSNAIIRFLRPDYTVLNVGCGDGYGFDRYCEVTKKMVGLDYSPEAIEKANNRYRNLVESGKAEFIVGDLLNEDSTLIGVFDAVISERCLCNLNSEEKHKKALEIIGNYLKPNGIAIISEPSLQGYNALDKIRLNFELTPIKRHWHNVLVNEDIFKSLKTLEIQEKYTFGVYTLISRLFYPLYIYPQEPMFDSDINKVAAFLCEKIMMESDYDNIPSQHVLYVLRRIE